MVFLFMKYLALGFAVRCCVASALHSCRCRKFKPDWKDLDTRLLPRWYDEAKVGIFIHWGVYSVPAVESEWFLHYSKLNNHQSKKFMDSLPKDFTYKDFAPMFRAELFDPDNWALLFKNAGANLSGWWARTMLYRYVVLTSKHHDGYTLFLSNRTRGWNSVDVGPQRDLVQPLAEAVRAKDMKFGLYYSLLEWLNPLYFEDIRNGFRTKKFSKSIWPEIKYATLKYKPSVFWSDGDWDSPSGEYWNAADSVAWLYNESPMKDELVTNDRWGNDAHNTHCDFFGLERNNPGHLLKHKFENAFTLDKMSWGYRRDMDRDLMTVKEMMYQMVSTVSYGGNVLVNVGPTKEGIIVPAFRERLLALGDWLAINGEAIYGSSPWMHQQDANSQVWYTCRRIQYNDTHPMSPPQNNNEVKAIYAIFLTWPHENVLRLKNVSSLMKDGYKVEMLGSAVNIAWETLNDEVQFRLPNEGRLKSKNAWTLKFSKPNFHS